RRSAARSAGRRKPAAAASRARMPGRRTCGGRRTPSTGPRRCRWRRGLRLEIRTAFAASPRRSYPNAVRVHYDPPMTHATFTTSEGTFKVRLFDDLAPKTVANFVGLASGTEEWLDPATRQKVKKPFYDGLIFHRVIDGFMLQGGCPEGTGRGGPGFKFADEFGPGLKHDRAG